MSLLIKNNPNTNSICTIQKVKQNDSSRWAMEKIKNRYILKEIMGQGTFGTVRKVRNKKTKQLYGCKTIPKSKLDGDLHLLKEEVSNLLSVCGHSPYILEFDQVFEDHDEVHIITELLEGGELYDKIIEMKERGPNVYFHLNDCAYMIRNICDGLSYCHDVAGIVHRDLKASNFMFKSKFNNNNNNTKIMGKWKKNINYNYKFNNNDVVSEEESNILRDIKIIDFGLSTKINPITGLVSGCLGTPYYVAPEVLTDEFYDCKCDVWSIGVIAYLILSFTLPYQGKDERETVHMLMDKTDKYLPKYTSTRWMHLAKVEPEAIDFCKYLLQIDPTKRPSMRQAMNHPWIVKHCGIPPPPQQQQQQPQQSQPELVEKRSSSQRQHQRQQQLTGLTAVMLSDNDDHGEEEGEGSLPLLEQLSTCSFQSFDDSQQQLNHNHNHDHHMESIPEQQAKKKNQKKSNILQRFFFFFGSDLQARSKAQ